MVYFVQNFGMEKTHEDGNQSAFGPVWRNEACMAPQRALTAFGGWFSVCVPDR